QGLASYAINRGWWADDGSKLDFVGALGEDPVKQGPALRRWGQMTLLLMEQSGHIDTAFLRRLQSDPWEEIASRSGPQSVLDEGLLHSDEKTAPTDIAAFVAPLSKDSSRLAMSWCAFGPPSSSVYFPIFLDGELPEPFTAAGQLSSTETLWRRLSRLGEQIA